MKMLRNTAALSLFSRKLCALLSASAFALSSFITFAQADSTERFVKSRTYAEGTFADVLPSAWYANDVKNAFEFGFINGKSANSFDPDGFMTVAEAATLCSRINAVYNSVRINIDEGSTNWYDSYVEYAKANGIISEGMFSSFNTPISRIEVAYMISKSIPQTEFLPINSVELIPDIELESGYYDSLLLLYNAGIVMGNDAYGNFSPDNAIKRCEVAAIINRVTQKESRLQKILIPTEKVLNPDTLSKRCYELKYLFAVKSFNNPSEIGVNRLAQYAFCHLYYQNLTDMPKESEMKYRSAKPSELLQVLYQQFNLENIDLTSSDLYNKKKGIFEMWQPNYSSTLYYDNSLDVVDATTFKLTVSFYSDAEKTVLKSTSVLTLKLDFNRVYIVSLA